MLSVAVQRIDEAGPAQSSELLERQYQAPVGAFV